MERHWSIQSSIKKWGLIQNPLAVPSGNLGSFEFYWTSWVVEERNEYLRIGPKINNRKYFEFGHDTTQMVG